MRIIAGKHRSRKLNTLEGEETRPTLDQVKEAVFSSLGGMFTGGWMLDLFSGSGAIGLEAISRGMDHVVLVDHNPKAIEVIQANVDMLKENEKCDVWFYDYHKALKQAHKKGMTFDVIYLDPPYHEKRYDSAMELIHEYNLLKDKGVLVVESSKEEEIQGKGFVCQKEKNYGKTRIRYYNKEEHK